MFRPAGNIIDLNQDQDKRPPMPLGAWRLTELSKVVAHGVMSPVQAFFGYPSIGDQRFSYANPDPAGLCLPSNRIWRAIRSGDDGR